VIKRLPTGAMELLNQLRFAMERRQGQGKRGWLGSPERHPRHQSIQFDCRLSPLVPSWSCRPSGCYACEGRCARSDQLVSGSGVLPCHRSWKDKQWSSLCPRNGRPGWRRRREASLRSPARLRLSRSRLASLISPIGDRVYKLLIFLCMRTLGDCQRLSPRFRLELRRIHVRNPYLDWS